MKYVLDDTSSLLLGRGRGYLRQSTELIRSSSSLRERATSFPLGQDEDVGFYQTNPAINYKMLVILLNYIFSRAQNFASYLISLSYLGDRHFAVKIGNELSSI